MIKKEYSQKQLEFINNATHRWNGKIGAVQCGKTYVDISFTIIDRILERKGEKGLNIIFGVTKETIERNILEPMRDEYGAENIKEINSRNYTYIFGEKIYCLGAEKTSQVSKVRGAKFKYVYIDEAVDINEEVFALIKSRMSLKYSVCDFAGNPSYPSHFIKKFIESDVDIYCQHYTIDDNPFLDKEYVENLKKEYAGTIYYDRYILGLWKKAEGIIYPMFNEKTHVCETKPREYTHYYVSMDYGIQNPTTFSLWGLYGGIWYKVKEYYHSGRETREQKTDQQYYDDLVAFCTDYVLNNETGEFEEKAIDIKYLIIDPSATSFITLVRKENKIKVWKARNNVLSGISAVALCLAANKIMFNGCCKRTTEEFGLYSWDKNSEDDKPIKENDHTMDDLRYFVYTMRLHEEKKKGISLW
ncbi:MAG: PBSX family phage terminase large subunit [Bacilli bacterium]